MCTSSAKLAALTITLAAGLLLAGCGRAAPPAAAATASTSPAAVTAPADPQPAQALLVVLRPGVDARAACERLAGPGQDCASLARGGSDAPANPRNAAQLRTYVLPAAPPRLQALLEGAAKDPDVESASTIPWSP